MNCTSILACIPRANKWTVEICCNTKSQISVSDHIYDFVGDICKLSILFTQN